ncbi:MAG: protein kinase [Anaerolineae bacterium]|nr:protein kinase [Anaerolineae bacterium]
MAEVYRGYHAVLDRYVAIKLLHPFLADDPEFKDRFEKEARNVARLKHPNIVQVYDFEYDSEGESYYMVMELINGPTLKDRLYDLQSSGGNVPINESVRIVKNAAEALAYAHQRSMIHRDVKPANLMLDEDGRVVLTDFGIAKIVTGTQFTASGGMIGTPAYMAPEQGLGEAGDERSDIYSLGVILFQLITGRLPYDADTPLAIILKHLNEPIPVPGELVPDLSKDLENIIYKAMAKEPGERYQTATELAYDLDRLDDTGHHQPMYDTPRVPSFEATPPMPRELTPSMPPPVEPSAQPVMTAPPLPDIAAPAPAAQPGAPGRLHPIWTLALVAGIAAIIVLALVFFGKGDTTFGEFLGLGDNDTNTPLPAETGQGSLTPATITPDATLTAGAAVAQVPDTPTATATATFTETPTPTSMPTYTVTPSPTLTATFTETPLPTPTLTPTPNLTGTALSVFFETQAAASPTPNLTQTIAACDFEYIVVEPENYNAPPPISDTINPRLVNFNQNFAFELVLRNTGSCPWPEGVRLTYNPELTRHPEEAVDLGSLEAVCGEGEMRPGTNFAAQAQSNFYFTGTVGVMEDSQSLMFTGTAPDHFGCYFGVWDLLYPNSNVSIGRPLLLTIRVWGG